MTRLRAALAAVLLAGCASHFHVTIDGKAVSVPKRESDFGYAIDLNDGKGLFDAGRLRDKDLENLKGASEAKAKATVRFLWAKTDDNVSRETSYEVGLDLPGRLEVNYESRHLDVTDFQGVHVKIERPGQPPIEKDVKTSATKNATRCDFAFLAIFEEPAPR